MFSASLSANALWYLVLLLFVSPPFKFILSLPRLVTPPLLSLMLFSSFQFSISIYIIYLSISLSISNIPLNGHFFELHPLFLSTFFLFCPVLHLITLLMLTLTTVYMGSLGYIFDTEYHSLFWKELSLTSLYVYHCRTSQHPGKWYQRPKIYCAI